ncbi:MAG: hypothetical protein AB7O24_26455 [Kofleriaceae bacterium]
MRSCLGVGRIVLAACIALAGCGGGAARASASQTTNVEGESRAVSQAERNKLAVEHHKIEAEQQEALAATCTEPQPSKGHERCLPSCYPTEPADPRAGTAQRGPVQIKHLVCQKPGSDDVGSFVLADEIAQRSLFITPAPGRFPKPHKKTTWQAEAVAAFVDAAGIKLGTGDVVTIAGAWRTYSHPLTKQRLRCVTMVHHTRSMRRGLDGCGSTGRFVCEATGNAAARGINVVHYRLAEARWLQAAGKASECQKAAKEAIAVSRGMPRWRQYAALNTTTWDETAIYRTRFDGVLNEESLFATVAKLGSEAEAIYSACGGEAKAATTVDDEQSFHMCW